MRDVPNVMIRDEASQAVSGARARRRRRVPCSLAIQRLACSMRHSPLTLTTLTGRFEDRVGVTANCNLYHCSEMSSL